MKILVEQGIIGFIFLLLIFIISIRSGWQLFQASKKPFFKGLGVGFLVCTICTMITNIFGDRWTYLQLGAYFWVFLGLVVRSNIITEKEKQNENTTINK